MPKATGRRAALSLPAKGPCRRCGRFFRWSRLRGPRTHCSAAARAERLPGRDMNYCAWRPLSKRGRNLEVIRGMHARPWPLTVRVYGQARSPGSADVYRRPPRNGAYTSATQQEDHAYTRLYTRSSSSKILGCTGVNRAATSKFLLLKKEATPEAAFQPFIFCVVLFARR